MKMDDIVAAIEAIVGGYAAVLEPELRASARAQLLALIEKLGLAKCTRIRLASERIDAGRFRSDGHLRGAISAHLDLAFRSSLNPGELLATVTRGVCRVTWHPDLPSFPIGVALALPAARLPRSRAQLFADESVTQAGAPLMVVFALATNPARLGAGAHLVRHLLGDCAQSSPRSRLVAFSPLTGLRARMIAMASDFDFWNEGRCGVDDCELLLRQVQAALDHNESSRPLPEPLRSWLGEHARQFAQSNDYVVGRFHRSQGATLIGVAHGADPRDSDGMWARGLFEYMN